MSQPSRADTLALMQAWTASDSLRKHMLAVEAAMRFYAAKLGQDVESWGMAGLIHDFDYERYPNASLSADQEHPAEGVRYLSAHGYSDEICDAVMGHAHYTGVARTSLMAKALFASDELTGLITASTLVKPSKNIADVDVAGLRKKMKDKAFARGVNRDDVIQGAEALGIPLDDHIATVLEAMRGAADTLGLDGRLAQLANVDAAAQTAQLREPSTLPHIKIFVGHATVLPGQDMGPAEGSTANSTDTSVPQRDDASPVTTTGADSTPVSRDA